MSTVEGLVHTSDFVANAAPVLGGRRHHMKKVSAKTIRKHLRKHGLKPKGRVVLKGGADSAPDTEAEAAPAMGGRRRHGGTKKHRRRRASASFGRMFGL